MKTTIGFGGDAKAKNSAAFFRTTFSLSDANSSSRYAAGIRYDDGAVVYLNGVEVFRSNVDKAKPGEPNETQYASSTVGGNDYRERHYWFFEIDPKNMRQGENVMAVSVHQANGSSSDLAMDLQIVRVDESAFSVVKEKAEALDKRFRPSAGR